MTSGVASGDVLTSCDLLLVSAPAPFHFYRSQGTTMAEVPGAYSFREMKMNNDDGCGIKRESRKQK